MLIIDGSQGEGGGQILRTALALSLCLNIPFKIINIRIGRTRPGLQPQHLAAVHSAAEIATATLEGAELHSKELSFLPGQVHPGEYRFDIGTAGSTSLVLQTILPALMLGTQPSKLLIIGGTHNPLAPTYEFLNFAFLPLINRMGPTIHTELVRPGFYPRGGGQLHVTIQPTYQLQPLHIEQRGMIIRQYARILSAHLPHHIAKREWNVIQEQLRYRDDQRELIYDDSAFSPGNVVSLILQSQNLCEVFTSLGEPGLPAEQVAQTAVNALKQYLNHGIPVDRHLADQLLLPMALAGSGSFHTTLPSTHARTNMEVIAMFTGKPFSTRELKSNHWEISLTCDQ
jgi:RNA 3'-terminal phosphate cyclase (ATP)